MVTTQHVREVLSSVAPQSAVGIELADGDIHMATAYTVAVDPGGKLTYCRHRGSLAEVGLEGVRSFWGLN